ncbi:MAG: Rrf2 family transcriptional regulator [Flavobacteriales bacterium]|nr:Rrf2 family transcriptional regulator [Flavobacteriales bacterium]
MFSKACEYGIRAAVCIAGCGREGERLSLKAIAERTDSPEAFTAKILQKLVHAGLVWSVKGRGGGFSIPEAEARRIRLSQIVACIDGDAIYRGCALGLPQCNARKPCPLHDSFLQVREDLRLMLERTTLHDLVIGLREGRTVLKR